LFGQNNHPPILRKIQTLEKNVPMKPEIDQKLLKNASNFFDFRLKHKRKEEILDILKPEIYPSESFQLKES
jgi:hypothetical protein